MPPSVPSVTNSLTITNPLVLYRSLLATKKIEPDLAQYRLALHLQKLYIRLKDYSPELEYGDRLKALTHVIGKDVPEGEENAVASPRHPLRRNPLFAHLFLGREQRTSLALTRIITSSEAAKELNSPKGLLLHGEVGRGKSMLVDLLAESLPTNKKRRWHFNTFMLETLARLEQLRIARSQATAADPEHSLLWLARDMIDNSPILFLDEFQLPDRMASKILSNLFTIFFQLGGVLVATSNRMPDELAKASGTDFTAPSSGNRTLSFLGIGKAQASPANGEYHDFVEILKARCDIFNMDNMEAGRDWRRREVEEDGYSGIEGEQQQTEMIDSEGTRVSKMTGGDSVAKDNSKRNRAKSPQNYMIGAQDDAKWVSTIRKAIPQHGDDRIPWESTAVQVYGRSVWIPRYYNGVSSWTFSQLCGERFGPADYITMASTFHTFIIDEVPTLTLSLKNEARRFITLLDALYEARCKLIIRADAGPDDLFFPEIHVDSNTASTAESTEPGKNDARDAVYPETFSEVYQDQTSPFRPNISAYMDEAGKEYSFGKNTDSSVSLGRPIDFGVTSSFIGEDERFAYKRASSRLWEMCGMKWHSRSEPGWWKPIPTEVRRWEQQSESNAKFPEHASPEKSDARMGKSYELDAPPEVYETIREDHGQPSSKTLRMPPIISWTHAWGMMRWGKKAGPWGQGPEGLSNRKKKD